jgi:hypothetical protein
MAEFNATAFSAVDAFFVIDKQGASNDVVVTTDSNHGHGKTRRMGVGAVATPGAKPSAAPTQLMKIGNKKRNREEEDDAEIIMPHNEIDDEEDEEDIGRTGIATQVAERKDQDLVDTMSGSAPKKKKTNKKSDKKERQKKREKEQAIQETTSAENMPSPTTNNPFESAEDAADMSNQQERELAAKTHNNEERPKEALSQQKQKRKRRKVRSRQKNIYKDNRAADKKPDHLTPGGYEYKGRPITAETRAKLAKKQGVTDDDDDSFTKNDEWKSSHWLDDNPEGDSGVPIFQAGETSKPKTGATIMDRSSRVDEVKNRSQTREKKKQKKPRYKNIQ